MLSKRLISGTAALALVLGCAGAPAFGGLSFGILASAEDVQNKCGDELVWDIDESGVLTVTGTGDMTGYAEGGAPWSSKAVTKVFIKKSAASVGSWALGGSETLVSTSAANTVLSVGNSAYENCSELQVADLTRGLKTVGDYAFCGCTKLLGVRIPASVTQIGEKAFGFGSRTDEAPNPDFKIYCYPGTAGEAYAKENNIQYELLEDNYTKADVVSVCYSAGGGNLIADPIEVFLNENDQYFNSEDYAAIIVGLKEASRRYIAPVALKLYNKPTDKLTETEIGMVLLMVSLGNDLNEIFNYLELVTETRGINITIGKDVLGKTTVDYKTTDEKKAETDVTATVVPVYNSSLEIAPDLTKAKLSVFDAEGVPLFSVNADADGRFTLYELGEGEYTLMAELDGFAPRVMEYAPNSKLGEIKLCKYGDVNASGNVDGADIALMQQKSAGWNVEFVYKEAADTDLSGSYTSGDLSRLQQYIAGWSVILGDGKTLAKK